MVICFIVNFSSVYSLYGKAHLWQEQIVVSSFLFDSLFALKFICFVLGLNIGKSEL